MKISKEDLQQIIKEELESIVQEQRTFEDSMIEQIVSAFQSMERGARLLETLFDNLANEGLSHGFDPVLVNNAYKRAKKIYAQVEESARLNNAIINDYRKKQK